MIQFAFHVNQAEGRISSFHQGGCCSAAHKTKYTKRISDEDSLKEFPYPSRNDWCFTGERREMNPDKWSWHTEEHNWQQRRKHGWEMKKINHLWILMCILDRYCYIIATQNGTFYTLVSRYDRMKQVFVIPGIIHLYIHECFIQVCNISEYKALIKTWRESNDNAYRTVVIYTQIYTCNVQKHSCMPIIIHQKISIHLIKSIWNTL